MVNEQNIQLFNKLKGLEKGSLEYLKIRDEIFALNMPLVTYTSKSYFTGNRQDNEDLFADASIGLLKAIETFNIDKGFKFATYASICISNSLKMAYRKDKRQPPTIDLETVISKNSKGEESHLEDILGAYDENLEDIFEREDLSLIQSLLDSLTPIQSQIIKLRYFSGDEVRTQEEVAILSKLSQSYVCRQEKAAFEKLKELIGKLERKSLNIKAVGGSKKGEWEG